MRSILNRAHIFLTTNSSSLQTTDFEDFLNEKKEKEKWKKVEESGTCYEEQRTANCELN